jgi:hypothetical protein
MYQATKELEPIRVPGNSALCWMSAHKDLVKSYIDEDSWVFMTLHSGHQIYGYYSEAGWTDYNMPDVYPERHCPIFWSIELAGCDQWTEAIKNIPELYDYYEPY